jgi:hypothetical protein
VLSPTAPELNLFIVCHNCWWLLFFIESRIWWPGVSWFVWKLLRNNAKKMTLLLLKLSVLFIQTCGVTFSSLQNISKLIAWTSKFSASHHGCQRFCHWRVFVHL